MNSTQHLASAFAIDLATQTVFPLADLPNHAPKLGRGKKLHSSTGYRWSNGVRAKDGTSVRLPTIQVGGTRCTSLEAFQWFCERLSARTTDLRPSTSSATRRKADLRAEKELDVIGI
jgi:hypothetical protein